ncbi:MAG: PAS domain-containing protein [Kiloniellaceae bacterium]
MAFEQRFHGEALRALYTYWQELRIGRPCPSRTDIDPSKVVTVLPHIGLFDVEESPRRYRIRLMGTQIVSWYGSDLSGSYLDEIDFGAGPSETFSILDQVVDRVVAGHMTGEYTKLDGRTIRYERLFMPLSSDGEKVDMVVGAAYRLPTDVAIVGDSLDL